MKKTLAERIGYTSGPWRECGHDRDGCSCGLIWSKKCDGVVAKTYDKKDDIEGGEGVEPDSPVFHANARLIAAAPQMLEALHAIADNPNSEEVMEKYEPGEMIIGVMGYDNMIKLAKETIESATGMSWNELNQPPK